MTPDLNFLESMTSALQTGGLGSFIVLLLWSAVSVSIGRSLIFLANQVTPLRLVVSLVVNALKFLVACAVWTVLPYLLSRYMGDSVLSLEVILVVVASAFAPLGSAWLGLLPYFGRGIMRILYFTSFVLLFIFFGLLGFENWVFVLLPAGFLLMTGINALLLDPLQNWAAGRKLIMNFQKFRV